MGELSPSLTHKLAALIPRLASDHEGEVYATVQAIRRTLDRAEMDLHDLAARLADPEPVQPRVQAQPQPEPRRDPQPTPEQDTAALLAKAIWLNDYAMGDLTEKQAAFVSTALRMLRSGQRLTDRQVGWLHGLCEMHGMDA